MIEFLNLSKFYNGEMLFYIENLAISKQDKIGITGPNGSGKTTFLDIITGKNSDFSGIINKAKGLKIGYLDQEELEENATLIKIVRLNFKELLKNEEKLRELEEQITKNVQNRKNLLEEHHKLFLKFETEGGFEIDYKIKSVLFGLGFKEQDFTREISTFSEGEKVKVKLARLLLKDASLLILDEPTNHLDIFSILWLENYLKDFKGALLISSHDGYFLDNIVLKILSFSETEVKLYKGNFSSYIKQRSNEISLLEKKKEKEEKFIKKEMEFIEKFRSGTRSRQAKSREKKLEKIEKIEIKDAPQNLKFEFKNIKETGEIVLRLEKISKSYFDKTIFKNFSLLIKKNEAVGIVGENGVGKTTLLKLITGEILPDGGEIYIGPSVKFAYFPQKFLIFNEDETLLDEFTGENGLRISEARNYLARFGFTGEDVFKSIKSLSSGEKKKLILAKISLFDSNLLLLDEPTNFLDLSSKEALIEILREFKGSIIAISHDREFLDSAVQKILFLDKNGAYKLFDGNFSSNFDSIFGGEEKRSDKAENKTLPFKKNQNIVIKSSLKAKIKELEEEIKIVEIELENERQEYLKEESINDWKIANEINEKIKKLEEKRDLLYSELFKIDSH